MKILRKEFATIMKDHYLLFLDEIKASTYFDYFCLAGCIIKEVKYNNILIPKINQLKQDLFGTTNIILHQVDIRNKLGDFRLLRRADKRQKFWTKLDNIFLTPDLFITIGAAIHCAEIKKMYMSDQRNDEYYIALQIIMENFTNFLEENDGIGTIFIESRNPTEDQKLQNHYHNLKATGTLFLNRNVIQQRLGTLSFPLKADNIVGLQVADFIPNPLSRHCGGMKQQNPSLHPHILTKLYKGRVNMPERFGLKKIP